ncbi:MAG: hypothetical protein KC684_06340 [Candidatus Omnitrophica bacterium]|nr:hypothetical protein [Candidatus Omnitrophota bacterium]
MIKNAVKETLILILLFSTSTASAQVFLLSDIKEKHIEKSLSSKWNVKSIKTVSAPKGWRRVSGKDGIQINLQREPHSNGPTLQKNGDYAVNIPSYYLCLMPKDFIGQVGSTDTIFEKGTIIYSPTLNIAGILILNFEGESNDFYVFSSGKEEELTLPLELATEIIENTKKELNNSEKRAE